MKKLIILLIILILASCVPLPQYMNDMMENQYFEKTIFADQNAPYIGEWTGATGPGLTALKINKDGAIKICSSNPHFGNSNGKVFKEDGKIKMIFESGTQNELVSTNKDHLTIISYGKEYKYYSGKVPDICKAVFANFKE